MAATQPPKIIHDIRECIQELKRDYRDSQIPINDDNTTLHKFCAKLELLLKTNRKEKTSLLGGRKDYWDYFYNSLYKVKGLNEGIRFVKSMPELRTSLGKGRAFIRYSLVQQRLADTFQQCVTNGKVTSDWYTPKSVLMNHSHKSALVSDLYDLNEIQFDLSPTGYDLDSDWPTFARKSFGTPTYGLWQPPSRSSSISSLTSMTSQQNDSLSFAPGSPHASLKQTIDEEKHSALQTELDQCEISIRHLQQRNEQLEKEREDMKGLALETETRMSEATSQMQKKIQEMEYVVSRSVNELEEKRKLWDEERGSLRSRLEDAESMNSDLYLRIDVLNKQHESREKVFADVESDLKERLQAKEASGGEMAIEIKGLQQQLEIQESEGRRKGERVQELEEKLSGTESKQQDLVARMEGLVNEKDSKASDHFDSANKAHALVEKMVEAERVNVELKGQNDELNRQLLNLQDKVTETENAKSNEIKLLQNESEEKYNSVVQSNEGLKKKLEETDEHLRDLKMQNQNLSESCEKFRKIVIAKDEEFEAAKVEMQATKETSRKIQEELNCKVNEVMTELESNKAASATEVEALKTQIADLEERSKDLSVRQELPVMARDAEVLESEVQQTCDEVDSATESRTSNELELEKELNEIRTVVSSAIACNSEPEIHKLSENVHDGNRQTIEALVASISELHKLRDSAKNFDNSAAEMREEIKGLKESCDDYQHELRDSKLQLADLKTCISKLENSEVTLQTSLEDRVRELEDLRAMCQDLETQKETLETRTKELQESASSNEEKFCDLEQRYETLAKDMSGLRDENDGLRKEKDEMNESMAVHETEIAEKVIQKDAEIYELMTREEKLQEELREFQEEREQSEGDLSAMTEKIAMYEGQLQEQQQKFDAEKSALEGNVETLREEYEHEKQNSQKLQITLEDLRRIHEEDLSHEEVFEERKQQVGKEYEDKVDFLKQQFQIIKEDLQEKLMAKSGELDALKEQFDLLLKEKNEIGDKNDILNTQISDLNEQCELLMSEKAEVQEKLEQSSSEAAEKITDVSLECDELVKNLNAVTLERDDVHRQITSIQKSTEDTDALLKSRDEKIQQLQEDANEMRATMETEISALQFQLSSETMQYQQQINAYADQAIEMISMRDKVAENEQLLTQLEETLEVTKAEWKRESETLSKELQRVTAMLSAKELQCKHLESDVDKLTTAIEMEKTATKEEKTKVARYEIQLANFERKKEEEMAQLEQDNEGLKRRLIKLIRDKDNLWQKTDWLAHQQKLQAAERWLDDKEVFNCMQCNTEFSLTVRRHHCRLCGRIFCYSCSNNWIMTKHSSKKTRACLTCYAKYQHQHEEGGIMDTSVVDNSDEDIDPAILKGHLQRFGSQSENSSTATSPDEEYSSRSNSRNSFVTASSGMTSPVSDDPKGIVASKSLDGLAENNEESSQQSADEGRKINSAASVVMTTEGDGVGMETQDEMDTSRDDVFDVIGEEEIARSQESEKKNEEESKSTLGHSLEVREDSLTSSLVMSAEHLESVSEESYEEWIKAGKSFAVPVKVDKPGIVLCWEFTTEPKNIAFSVTYKENEETRLEDSQVLIPLCRCNSHRQSVQGELIAKQPGIYTLVFDNSFSRFTSKKARYKLQIKRPGP